MEMQKHKICKQIIMLSLQEQSIAWQTQQEIEEVFKRKALPRMNEILSQFSTPESILRIEKLEIDLGNIHPTNIEEEFTIRLEKMLYERLSNYVEQLQLDTRYSQDRCLFADNALTAAMNNDTQKRIRTITGNINELEMLRHFLETGTLPWWAEKHSTGTLDATFLRLLETNPAEMRLMLEEELKSESARQRMVYQFSDTVHYKIVNILVPGKAIEIIYIFKELCKICENVHLISVAEAELHFLFWDNILKAFSTIKKDSISGFNIIEAIIKSISSWHNIPYDQLIPEFKEVINKLLQSQFDFNSEIPEFVSCFHISGYTMKSTEGALDSEKRALQSLGTKPFNSAEEYLPPGTESSNRDINDPGHFHNQKTLNDKIDTIDGKEEVKQTGPEHIGSSIDDLQHREESLEISSEAKDPDIIEKKTYTALSGPSEKKRNKQSDSDLHFLIWENVLKSFSAIDNNEISETKIIEFVKRSILSKHNVPSDKLFTALQGVINKLFLSQFTFINEIPEYISRLKISKPDMKNIEYVLDLVKRKHQSSDSRQVSILSDNELSNKVNNNIQLFDEQLTSIDETGAINKYNQINSVVGAFGTSTVQDPLGTEQNDDNFDFREIYIENSGLVILWPYLGKFFKNIKLSNEGEFVNEYSAMRAVHLLQYLVTDKCEFPEHLLPLNKLLCGRDVSRPISNTFEISDYERDECEKLLSTVIKHWSALRNTSIEGFKATFLQRNGVLVREEACWLLRVERKTYDMLIDVLPWGISMIKLSWMKTLLNVEW